MRLWYFDSVTKQWSFYDPRPGLKRPNLVKELLTGDIYLIEVRYDGTATLNGFERTPYAGWNFLGW